MLPDSSCEILAIATLRILNRIWHTYNYMVWEYSKQMRTRQIRMGLGMRPSIFGNEAKHIAYESGNETRHVHTSLGMTAGMYVWVWVEGQVHVHGTGNEVRYVCMNLRMKPSI